VTTLVGATQFAFPAVLQALQRDPVHLRAGQWWRLASPLLVQPSGWGQYAYNLLGSIVVGVAVERHFGGRQWLTLYLIAGLAGNVMENVWFPTETGGGSSDAVAGLIGGLTVAIWSASRMPTWPSYLYAAYFASYLTVLKAAGVLPGMVLGAAAAAVVMGARRGGHLTVLRALVTALVVAGATAMTAMQDSHGIGLFTGLALGLFMNTRKPRAQEGTRATDTNNEREQGSWRPETQTPPPRARPPQVLPPPGDGAPTRAAFGASPFLAPHSPPSRSGSSPRPCSGLTSWCPRDEAQLRPSDRRPS